LIHFKRTIGKRGRGRKRGRRREEEGKSVSDTGYNEGSGPYLHEEQSGKFFLLFSANLGSARLG
jgi:hypothetical protein